MSADNTAPTPAFSQPKIVEKAFSLPLVSDTYSHGQTYATSLLTSALQPYVPSPLQPYLSSSLASLTPVLQTQLSHLFILGEERLPEVVTSRVTAGAEYLDSTACSGLDQLVEKVPSLKSSTQDLYSSTKEAAVSQLNLATTYLASFDLAQLVLKVSDASLETAEAGIKKIRSQVEEVRREGARANGSQKVADMAAQEEVVAEVEQ